MNQPDTPERDIDAGAMAPDNDRQIQHSDPAANVQRSLQKARRSRFIRMLLLPILLGLVFIVLVFLIHDLFVKNECIHNMEKIGRQIATFKNERSQTLPNHQEFLQFEIHSRNLRIRDIHYDKTLILKDGPADTILSYTARPGLRLLADGHAVLYVNGNVEWVTPDRLRQLLDNRQQQYNRNILRRELWNLNETDTTTGKNSISQHRPGVPAYQANKGTAG
ncbi:MAG: hypothetical protein KAJ46_06910 [Sedimentisphaerales bacterium]|nr:hypothetical protein [Sedimentisphaerales bacterium]